MPTKAHTRGFCTCQHTAETWNRPRHWAAKEVAYLHEWYGRTSDEHIAEHLGRPVLGVRLKAKRLKIHKRDVGLTARSAAQIFGVDATTLSAWIDQGLLRASRAYKCGVHRTRLISYEAVEDFIRDHGQYIEMDKMPESWYRDLAAKNRWYSLAEVELLVGQSPYKMKQALESGQYRFAMRGPHFYVAAEELSRIREATDEWRRSHLTVLSREREERLKRRRDKRKGIGRYRQAA